MGSRLFRWVLPVAVLTAMLAPLAVLASPGFDDVPASNVFYDDIEWLAAVGVTKGCNPPANTEFCPEDFVTREQMAAFMHRLAESRAVDAGSLDGMSADEFVGPQGPVGPEGPVGPQGEAGPAGPAGVLNFYTVESYVAASTVGYYSGSAWCDAGDIASGGGVQLHANSTEYRLMESMPATTGTELPAGWSPTGWKGEVWNGIDHSPGYWAFRVWAVCADMTQ